MDLSKNPAQTFDDLADKFRVRAAQLAVMARFAPPGAIDGAIANYLNQADTFATMARLARGDGEMAQEAA